MARVNKFDQDEDLNAQIDKGQILKAKQYIMTHKKEFVITLIIMLVATVASMSTPLLLSIAMDDYIPNGNVQGLLILGGILLITFFIAYFSAQIRMKLMNRVGQGIIFDLRRDLFSHLQKLPYTYFDTRPHGKILVRVVNYINSLSDMFSNGLVNTVMEVVSLVIILIFMFIVDVRLTLVSLCGLPLLVAGIWMIKSRHRRAWQDYSNKNSNLNAYLHESISGVRVTQAFVREKRNAKIFRKLSLETRSSFMRAKVIEMLVFPMAMVISEATVMVVYYLGAMSLEAGMQIGTIVAMVSYVYRFWGPINNMSNIYNTLMTNAAYLERIFETMEEDVTIHDVPNAGTLANVQGGVEFKNVSFAYEPGVPILEDISFSVKPGQRVALVGATGAGKTTIVNLLSRYYDVTGGNIYIDGTDIGQITVKSLRGSLGYMLQDSFVFSGTIMENIRYGKLDATDDEVIEAAKMSLAHEFIAVLPNGYHTHVSERGSTLSAGQRQLISLARAMLRNPSILILDEATSSIDTETEQKLMRGIEKLLRGRTSFLIAHRLSTIKNADCIMVIGDRGILEQGNHEELMALRGKYYDLCKTASR